VPALERHRLGYVDHTYLRADNYGAANPHLIAKQAGIGFAQALGGGLVGPSTACGSWSRCRPLMLAPIKSISGRSAE
jgi:hypothetical protein